MPTKEFALSDNPTPLNYLVEYKIPYPLQHYQRFSEAVIAADGSVVGRGWPVISWYWSFLDREYRDILKTFCPDSSAEVYVRTQDEELDWHTYRCKMNWPVQSPDIQNNFSMKLNIFFLVLEQMD